MGLNVQSGHSLCVNNLCTWHANCAWYVSLWLQFMLLLISVSPAVLWEKQVWAQHSFFERAALWVSMQRLFLLLSVSRAQPVFLFGARWSIKTIFLMFALFAPVLDHPWMSTLRRMVASVRIILFQSQTVCPFQSSSTKAILMYALCPLHPPWHSKSLWECRRALLIRFHQCIIGMSFCYWPFTCEVYKLRSCLLLHWCMIPAYWSQKA